MKKIVMSVLVFISLFSMACIDVQARSITIVPPEFPEGGSTGGGGATGGVSTTNLSSFSPIIIDSGTINASIRKIGSTPATSASGPTSNAGALLGYHKTEFEHFLFETAPGNPNFVIITFEISLEPQDNVKFKNGLGNWFTEYGEATCKYTQISNSVDLKNSQMNLYNVGPESTILTSTTTTTISYESISYGEYGSMLVPVATVSRETQHQSVEVKNNSSPVSGKCDLIYNYPLSDGYACGYNQQYGYIILEVAKSVKDFFVYMTTTTKFSVGRNEHSSGIGKTDTKIHVSY